MRSGLASFAASVAVTAAFAVDWLPDRSARFLPVVVIGVALGLMARALRHLGHPAAARGLAIGTLAGAVLIAFGEMWPPRDNADALYLLILQAPALAVFMAMAMPRYAASFSFGAFLGLGAIGTHVFVAPYLLPLGFVIGRRAWSGTVLPSSHVRWSMAGVGALSMILLAGLATDAYALAREMAGPVGGPLSPQHFHQSFIDGWTTFVPRVLIEVVLLRACVGASRGHASGIVVLTVLAPVLAIVSWSDLPFFRSGCFSSSHPFRHGALVLLPLAIAVGPWLWRFARRRLAEPQPEACAR